MLPRLESGSGSQEVVHFRLFVGSNDTFDGSQVYDWAWGGLTGSRAGRAKALGLSGVRASLSARGLLAPCNAFPMLCLG